MNIMVLKNCLITFNLIIVIIPYSGSSSGEYDGVYNLQVSLFSFYQTSDYV